MATEKPQGERKKPASPRAASSRRELATGSEEPRRPTRSLNLPVVVQDDNAADSQKESSTDHVTSSRTARQPRRSLVLPVVSLDDDRAADPQVDTSPEQTPRQRPRTAARKQEARRKQSRLLLYFGIACFVVAGIIAGSLIYRYASASATHDFIIDASGIEIPLLGKKVHPETSIEDLEASGIDWDALRETNPDIVGWLMIPDTVIHYPIVQTNNNDYYLNHLSDGTPNGAGAIFLDYLNDQAISGMNNFIYGHNLIDGTMFASLKHYRDRAYFDEHKRILLSTPDMNYELEVVASLVCDADDSIRRFSFSSRVDYEAYVRMLLGYAVISDVDLNEIPDKIYCFVTCTDFNYAKRIVILAKVVVEQPPKGAKTT